MSKLEPITEATQESDIPADRRLDNLLRYEIEECVRQILKSILARKDTQDVPDILHQFNLLTQFEVYDAEAAWTNLEDEIRQLRGQV